MEAGNNTEQPTKLEYGSLTAPQKTMAILGASPEPVSKLFVIDFIGVDYNKLDAETKAQVDAVFSGKDVEITEETYDGVPTNVYKLNDTKKEELAQVVDMQSVHKVIADKMVEMLGLEG